MNLRRYYSPEMIDERGRLRPLQSKSHLAWVAEKSCIVSRSDGKIYYGNDFTKVDCHHVELRSRSGGNTNDYTCVPMLHKLHGEYHRTGHDTFENKYAFDMKDALIATLIERVVELEGMLRL